MTSTLRKTMANKIFPTWCSFTEPEDGEDLYRAFFQGVYRSTSSDIRTQSVVINIRCEKNILSQWLQEWNVSWQEAVVRKFLDALTPINDIVETFDAFAADIPHKADMASKLQHESLHWPTIAETLQQKLQSVVTYFLSQDYLERHLIKLHHQLDDLVDNTVLPDRYSTRNYRVLADVDDLELEIVFYHDFQKDGYCRTSDAYNDPIYTPPQYYEEFTFSQRQFQSARPRLYTQFFPETPEQPLISVDIGYKRQAMTLHILPKGILWTESSLQDAIMKMKDIFLSIFRLQQATYRQITVADLDIPTGKLCASLKQLVDGLSPHPAEMMKVGFHTSSTIWEKWLVDCTVWLEAMSIRTQDLDVVIEMDLPPWRRHV